MMSTGWGGQQDQRWLGLLTGWVLGKQMHACKCNEWVVPVRCGAVRQD